MESLFFPLVLAMLALFMFFSVRKQKKRVAEMQEMQNSVSTGARVQLTSGMFATVVDSTSDYVDLEIAHGVITRFNRLAIVRVVPTEEAADTYPGALTAHQAPEPEQLPDTHTETYFENPSNPTDDK